MMNTTINCPDCGSILELEGFHPGDIVDCPACGHSFIIDSAKVNKVPCKDTSVSENSETETKPLLKPALKSALKSLTPPITISRSTSFESKESEQVELLRKLVKYQKACMLSLCMPYIIFFLSCILTIIFHLIYD